MNNISQRSVDVDSENHTLSIIDESEAKEVLDIIIKESKVAGNVWGDIYRNQFLASLSDKPSQMTPGEKDADGEGICHGSFKVEKLQKSKLWEGFIPPEQRRQHGSVAVAVNKSSNKSLLERDIIVQKGEYKKF